MWTIPQFFAQQSIRHEVKIMSKRRLALIGIMWCSSLYGQVKPGGICFRFDDNQPLAKMRQIAAVFDKYQFPFTWSINADALPSDPAYLNFLRDLEAKGCEIMDHAPNHCTQVFWTTHMASYMGRAGVDHINGRTICLKLKDIDSTKLFSPGEITITKNFTVLNTDERLRRNLIPGNILVGTSAKRLLSIDGIRYNAATRTDTVTFRSYWSEQENEKPTLTLKYGLVNVYDTQLTDDAVKLLAEEALRAFEDVGLKRPTTFIHPGGFAPQLSTATIKRIYGDLYGYTAAATDGGLQCYNDANTLAPFCMQWGDFSAGINPADDKKTISSMIAKHYFLIGGSHLRDIGIDWNVYLAQIDSLLNWCTEEQVSVTTYSRIADILYSEVTDAYANVFPLLKIDLDMNGVPDGYDSFAGSVDSVLVGDKMYDYVRSSHEGVLFRVSDLAGLEKGYEDLRFRARGSVGAKIILTTRIQARKDTTVYVFAVKDTGWTNFSLKGTTNDGKSINMLPNYSYRTFVFALSDLNGQEFDLGQINLRKISKSDSVLPPYLSELKIDTLNKRLEFTVDLRDQNHRTIIERSNGGDFSPLGVVSNSETITDNLRTIDDSVTYRAYSVADTIVSEYAYLFYRPVKMDLESVLVGRHRGVDLACFPNPFNPSINILYTLDRESNVTLQIYDISGRMIKTLYANERQSKGDHMVAWNATNNFGAKISSGVYFCRYVIGSNQATESKMFTKKILYLK
jgi:hypothetical protein